MSFWEILKVGLQFHFLRNRLRHPDMIDSARSREGKGKKVWDEGAECPSTTYMTIDYQHVMSHKTCNVWRPCSIPWWTSVDARTSLGLSADRDAKSLRRTREKLRALMLIGTGRIWYCRWNNGLFMKWCIFIWIFCSCHTCQHFPTMPRMTKLSLHGNWTNHDKVDIVNDSINCSDWLSCILGENSDVTFRAMDIFVTPGYTTPIALTLLDIPCV